MSTSWVWVHLLFGVISICSGDLLTQGVPDGYIVQVTPTCGSDGVVDASIDIVTDLNANAQAYCGSDQVVNFTTTDGVNFHLPVSYPARGSSTCQFWKRQGSEVYAIKVIISYGETGSFVHSYELEYTVTCTFDPKGTDTSGNQNIIEGLIAPAELQTNVGSSSTFTFILELVNVLGESLAGQGVALGRIVLLQAITGAVGLRPVSCDAIDGSKKYAILRAGCGDGIVFKKHEGFTTTGNKTDSPYFKAFSINTAVIITFECNFVECGSNCDGSSCVNG